MATETAPPDMIPYNQEPIDNMEIMDMMGVNPGEPEPHPNAMKQNRVIRQAIDVPLSGHLTKFDKIPTVFLDYNTYICYDRSDLSATVQPNCYVAFGVDSEAIRQREVYLPWEAGKVPDFTLDVVASEDAAENDVPNRLGIYKRMGVSESWLFDITGGDLLGEPILGYFLADGEHRPAQVSAAPNGTVSRYSPALGLHLCWDGRRLRFRDPLTGEYLRNTNEFHDAFESEQIAHAGTRQRLGRERIAHAETQQALERERREREAERAEHERERERTRRLEEELRRLRGAE